MKRPIVLFKCFACALALGINGAVAAPIFNLTFTGSGNATNDALGLAGFQAAAAGWSSLFTDNITINLNVGYSALGTGILAQASSTQVIASYASVRNQMVLDATSTADASAVAHLATGPSFGMLINGTTDNPNGAGSLTPYVDSDGGANNNTLRFTSANAKALGYSVATASDASISFSTGFTWDFDRGDGITAGAFDFVGIAMHEIGHALGFISGVDVLDGNAPPSGGPFGDNAFTYVSTLDLFRYSSDSTALGVIDWTADSRAKYLSIDGGTSALTGFSTGPVHGDGRQASHWKDNLGLGIMDPTSAPGELLQVTANDLRGFDIIGWNLASVPETSSVFVLLGMSVVGMAIVRRRVSA